MATLKQMYIYELINWHNEQLAKLKRGAGNSESSIFHTRALEMLAFLSVMQAHHYGHDSLRTKTPASLVGDVCIWRNCKAPVATKEFFENAARLADEAAKIFEERKKKGDL